MKCAFCGKSATMNISWVCMDDGKFCYNLCQEHGDAKKKKLTSDQISFKEKELKQMKLVNLTPHTVNFYHSDSQQMFEYKSEGVARVATSAKLVSNINVGNEVGNYTPAQIFKTIYDKVEGLPEPQPDTYYIVSLIVLQHPSMKKRKDVIAPGTGPNDNCIRENGLVKAVTRFICP